MDVVLEYIELIGIGAAAVVVLGSALWAVHTFHLKLNKTMSDNLSAMEKNMHAKIVEMGNSIKAEMSAPLKALERSAAHVDKMIEVYHVEVKDSHRRIERMEDEMDTTKDNVVELSKKVAIIETQLKGRRHGDS